MLFLARFALTIINTSYPILKIIVPKPQETLGIIHSPIVSQTLSIIDPIQLLVSWSKNAKVKS